jgi:hypothetical protein
MISVATDYIEILDFWEEGEELKNAIHGE